MIERLFENILYGSYPQNYDFDDLNIEYEQRIFKKIQIDSLTNNKVERLKFSLIKRSSDNRIYKSNPQNSVLNYLPFDDDESLIARG